MSPLFKAILHITQADGLAADYATDLTDEVAGRELDLLSTIEIALTAIQDVSEQVDDKVTLSGISFDLGQPSLPYVVFFIDDQKQTLRRTVVASAPFSAAATVIIEHISAIYDPFADFKAFVSAVRSCDIVACHLATQFSRPLTAALHDAAKALNLLTATLTAPVLESRPSNGARPANGSTPYTGASA